MALGTTGFGATIGLSGVGATGGSVVALGVTGDGAGVVTSGVGVVTSGVLVVGVGSGTVLVACPFFHTRT